MMPALVSYIRHHPIRIAVLFFALLWVVFIGMLIAGREERASKPQIKKPVTNQKDDQGGPSKDPIESPGKPKVVEQDKHPSEPSYDLVEWSDERAVAAAARIVAIEVASLEPRRRVDTLRRVHGLVAGSAAKEISGLLGYKPFGPVVPKGKVYTMSLSSDRQTGARFAVATVDLPAFGRIPARRIAVTMEFAPSDAVVTSFTTSSIQ